MNDYLSFSVDKFTFRTATDRFYNGEGVWARLEDNLIRIGVSDFWQQRSGDVAFVEIKPTGTEVAFGDEIAVIETIKVNISLTSPATGRIIEVNPVMETTPEVLNQDPYGAGWLVILRPTQWDRDMGRLLDPQKYLAKTKAEAEMEANN